MVDFSGLLKAPAGQASRPKPLPVGNYPGIIKSFSMEAAPAGKDYTAMVRFQVGLLDWPELGVSEEDKVQTQPDGSSRQIDLSKRQLRKDFYDNSLFRLDDFIKSCSVEINGRTYEEVLPELIGARVVVGVEQYLNQQTNDLGNQIRNLVGQS